MFNRKLKEKALFDLKIAEDEYVRNRRNVQDYCKDLFEARVSIAENVIKPVENYINTLSKKPIELEKSIAQLSVNYASFAEVFTMQKDYSDQVDKLATATSAIGFCTGVAVATLAPRAAIAVATTFGTASTGTAISSLSGAAATRASLAWLGRGALSAGGSGVVAGKALLAMSGPIGWAVAGVAFTGSIWWSSSKNKKIANKAMELSRRYKTESAILIGVEKEVMYLHNFTLEHSKKVREHLDHLIHSAPKDYTMFSEKDKVEVAILVNNINALSKLLNSRVKAD